MKVTAERPTFLPFFFFSLDFIEHSAPSPLSYIFLSGLDLQTISFGVLFYLGGRRLDLSTFFWESQEPLDRFLSLFDRSHALSAIHSSKQTVK